MKLTNVYGYPQCYVEKASHYIYQPKEGRIGIIQLINPPKARRLMIDHWENLVIDVSDLFKMMLGSAWHEYLESGGKKETSEIKWEFPFKGWTIVGKADTIGPLSISDHKLYAMFAWSRKAVDETVQKIAEQLNILRWLRKNVAKEDTTELYVNAFISDWSKTKALKDPDLPQSKFLKIDVPIWEDDRVEEFISTRLLFHENPTDCTDEEKWCRLEKWAVMDKKKPDKAKRLLDTRGEAEKFILDNNLSQGYARGDIYIEERKSHCTNCEEWCLSRSVCPFALGLSK